MATDIPPPLSFEWPVLLDKVKDVFSRSRLFREVNVSGPEARADGQISMEVGFGGGPAFIRVVAPSPHAACAVLYELACTMVEVQRSRPPASEA